MKGKSIAQYYEEKFGVAVDDVSLIDLPVKSGCGEDCKRAIDQAKKFYDIAKRASPKASAMVLKALDETIGVFWHG